MTYSNPQKARLSASLKGVLLACSLPVGNSESEYVLPNSETKLDMGNRSLHFSTNAQLLVTGCLIFYTYEHRECWNVDLSVRRIPQIKPALPWQPSSFLFCSRTAYSLWGKGHVLSAECPGEVTLVFPKWTSVRVMVRAEDRWTCAPCCICLWDLKTWTWLLFKHAILVWLCQKGIKFEDMPFYMSGTHLNGGGGGGGGAFILILITLNYF